MIEANVQTELQLEAGRLGHQLWRNNVGALVDERGVPVRFGLANESKQENADFKSSDLIGFTRVTVPQGVIAQFTAVEVKERGWQFGSSKAKLKREQAQLNYIEFVRAHGGIAGFCTCIEDYVELINTGSNCHP